MLGERRLAVPMLRDGALVVTTDPATGRVLSAEGTPVIVSTFWFRRARDQDVELRDMPTEVPSAPTTDTPGETPAQPTPDAPKKRRTGENA